MQILQDVKPGGREAVGSSQPALARFGWKQSCYRTLRRQHKRRAGRAAVRGVFLQLSLPSVDNLQAGEEVDENTGDGKGQPSCKEIPFHFSSRKTCLSALKLILKPAVLSQTLHLNFPLHMNSSTLQMENPAQLWLVFSC